VFAKGQCFACYRLNLGLDTDDHISSDIDIPWITSILRFIYKQRLEKARKDKEWQADMRKRELQKMREVCMLKFFELKVWEKYSIVCNDSTM
jgi:hypothetical protein